MKKSIFLFFAAILCATSVQGAVVTPVGKYFYFKPSSDWKKDGARFAVCFQWKEGGGQEDNWQSCVAVPGATDIYYVKAPAKYWDMFFCRMNGSNQTNDWSNKWNQTDKLQYDGSKNYWTKSSTDWNGAATYSTYAPPMSSVTLADNGTTVNSGTGTQADPYIIEIGTKIKVQASGTKAVDDPDAVISYAFKYGATSQDSETTTWEIDANSPSTTYAIELEGYTKVNTTSSEKKAATKLYYQTVADATLPTYQVTVTANNPAMGTVTGAGEYSEGATAELTANPNDGYKFVNWTVGSTEKSTNPTYSFTVTENVTLVANFQAIPEETVYFINTYKWTGTINAYAWTDGTPKVENAGWAGLAATKEDFQIGGYDVYSYTAKQGLYANVIFNGTGGQTTDLTWSDGVGKYYAPLKNEWYDTKEAAAEALAAPVEYEYVYLINTNDWAKAYIYTWESEVHGWPGAEMTKEDFQIAGKDVYSYKVVKGTTFGGLNFNCGGDECKTGDLTWQAGKYYAPLKNEWYDTKEAAAEALAAPVEYEYVYLINTNDWAKAYIYTWESEVHGWPGAEMTKEAEQIAGKDVYSYKVVKGTTFGGLNFNCGGDECKTGDLTWQAGKYYAPSTSEWYADAATAEAALAAVVTYDYYLTGSLVGGWDVKQQGIEKDGELYKATFNALAAGTYEFKITAGDWEHQWNYNNLGAAYEEVSQGVDGEGNPNGNIKFVTEEAKNITVIFDPATGKITIEGLTPYVAPLTYTVTVPAGTEKCYIAGAFAQSNWNTFLEMEQVVGEDKFTITITGAKETDEYKYACQADWAYAEVIDGGGNRTNWSELDEVTAWGKPAVPTLMGIGGDWTTGIEMEEDGDQFKLLCQPIAEGEQFKFKYGDTWTTEVENYDANGVNWVESYPGSGQYNITLPAGKYNFYYKKATNQVYITVATYTRAVTPGNFGTICLPYAGTITGATLFVLSYKDANYVYVDEVVGTTLVAGTPYLFLPTSTEITVNYTDGTYKDAGQNGALYGTYEDMDNAALMDKYIISGNKYYLINNATGNSQLPKNRAYFVLDEVSPDEPVLAPSARRIALGTNGQNTATGMENVDASAQPVKTIINGQLFILRGEKMYDAQGKLVK